MSDNRYDDAFIDEDGDPNLLEADAGMYDDLTPDDRPLVDLDQVLQYWLGVEAHLSLAFSNCTNDEVTTRRARGIISRAVGFFEHEDADLVRRHVPHTHPSFLEEYDPSAPSEAERAADRLAGRDPQ